MPVTSEHIEKIYHSFRKAQADHFNRGYRMPKDFEKHFNTKFKEQNKKALIKITGWFLTKWQMIDPYRYFKCGFELHDKRFTYTKFFKEKILLLYKTRDKIEKREVQITKKNILESAKFVKSFMNAYSITNLDEYISLRVGNQRLAVEHYLKNKIDATFLVFLIRKGMILTDTERSIIPYVQKNYRKIIFGLNDIEDFVKKLGEKL